MDLDLKLSKRTKAKWFRLHSGHLFLIAGVFALFSVATTLIGNFKCKSAEARKDEHRLLWLGHQDREDSLRVALFKFGSRIRLASLDPETSGAALGEGSAAVCAGVNELSDYFDSECVIAESTQVAQVLARLGSDIDSLRALSKGLHSVSFESDFTRTQLGQMLSFYLRMVETLEEVRILRRSVRDISVNIHETEARSWQDREDVLNGLSILIICLVTILGIYVARQARSVVDERARQFQKLNESETRFRSVMANVPGVIFRSRIAEDWPLEFISEHIYEVSGYPASDFLENSKRRFGSIIHPADVDRMLQSVRYSIRDDVPYSIEYRIIHASGEIVWVSETGQVTRDKDGRPAWLDGALIDISEKRKVEEALISSEETLRVLIDSSPGIALLINRDGRILAANHVFAKKVNLSTSQLRTRLLYEVSDLPMISVLWKNFRQVVETGTPCNCTHHDGSRYSHIHFQPAFDLRGELSQVGIFCQDITELRSALDESQRLRSILDQTSDAVAMMDANSMNVYANSAAQAMLGIIESTGPSKVDLSKHHPIEVANMLRSEAFPHAIRHGIWQGEIVVKGPNGTEIPASQVLIAHKSPDGKLQHMSTIIRDLSERKQIEKQLAEKNNLLREMLNAIPMPVFYKDVDFRHLGCNSAFENFFGVREAEVVGKFSEEFMPFDSAVDTRTNDGIALSDDRECLQEISLKNHLGKNRKIMMYKAPMKDTAGEIIGLVGVLMDLTERKELEEALRLYESQLKEITATIPGVVYQYQLDKSGEMRFRFASEGTNLLFGFTPEELLQDANLMINLFHPEDAADLMASIQPSADALSIWEYEFRVLQNGRIRWFKASAVPQRLDDGSTLWNGMLLDTTAQRAAEEHLQILVRSAIDAILTFTHTGHIESVNPAGELVFGYPADQLTEMSIMELVAEPHRSRYLDLLQHPDSQQASHLLEGVHEVLGIRSDEQLFPMDLAISTLKVSDGLKYLAIIRDITERKTNQLKIIESEAKLQAILRSAGDGVIVVDCDGTVQIFNDAATKIFGYDSEEIIGENIAKLVPEFSSEKLPTREASITHETIGVHSSRGRFPLQLSISCSAPGGHEIFAIIARDLTDELSRRDQLIEADKFTAIGTLAAGIAHEFKNYLAGIIGNASFAVDALDDVDGKASARDAFEQIINIGLKANDIALSLLTFSRQRSEDLELLDLREIVQSTLKFMSKEFAEKRVNLSTTFKPIPKLMLSANRVQQVLLNLLINATQAIDSDGSISISTGIRAGNVELKVEDNGKGIAPENIKRVFDPFFSTKGVWGKELGSGTGLGLFMSKNIMNTLSGEIEVESVEGMGSTFTLSWPVPLPNRMSDSTGVRVPPIRRALLFTSDAATHSAYIADCVEVEVELVVTTSDKRLASLDLGPETLLLADCSTPFKAELFRTMEYCRSRGLSIILLNVGYSAVENQQLLQMATSSHRLAPSLAEILATHYKAVVSQSRG